MVRPTGLTDPEVEIRPVGTQVDDLLSQINERVGWGDRVLVTAFGPGLAVESATARIAARQPIAAAESLRVGQADSARS